MRAVSALCGEEDRAEINTRGPADERGLYEPENSQMLWTNTMSLKAISSKDNIANPFLYTLFPCESPQNTPNENKRVYLH